MGFFYVMPINFHLSLLLNDYRFFYAAIFIRWLKSLLYRRTVDHCIYYYLSLIPPWDLEILSLDDGTLKTVSIVLASSWHKKIFIYFDFTTYFTFRPTLEILFVERRISEPRFIFTRMRKLRLAEWESNSLSSSLQSLRHDVSYIYILNAYVCTI